MQFHGTIDRLNLSSIMTSTKNRKDFEGLKITANYAEGRQLIHWYFLIIKLHRRR